MKLSLSTEELHQAITAFVEQQGINLDNKELSFDTNKGVEITINQADKPKTKRKSKETKQEEPEEIVAQDETTKDLEPIQETDDLEVDTEELDEEPIQEPIKPSKPLFG